jgi:pantoate kinase
LRRTSKAFSPAAISSFFEICDTKNGKQIIDLARVGARGGGFGLLKGTTTNVTVEESEENGVKVFINKKPVNHACISHKVAEVLLAKTSLKYAVVVEHEVAVPIGMGFGTSAAGALNTGLALKEALDLPLTYNQIGTIAHIAEIECQTGLGTVSSLTFGGKCILVTEPGAPGICQTDRIPVSPNYVLVAGFFDSKIPKSTIFTSPQRKKEITAIGKKTMRKILDKPNIENFLFCCWDFSQKAGFATEKVCRLVELASKAGAVGSAQNMVGEVVHSLVLEEKADCVAQAFMQVLPKENVIVSKLDSQGARLIK